MMNDPNVDTVERIMMESRMIARDTVERDTLKGIILRLRWPIGRWLVKSLKLMKAISKIIRLSSIEIHN